MLSPMVERMTIVYVEHGLSDHGRSRPCSAGTSRRPAPSILSLGVFGLLLIVIMLFFPHGLLPGVAGGIRSARNRIAGLRRSA